MSTLKIGSVFTRKDFFAAPNAKGDFWVEQAGGVIATTDAKAPRMFVHAKRYRTFGSMHQTVEAIAVKGAINTDHWVEVDVAKYVSHDAIVHKNGGEVFRHGALHTRATTDAEAIGEQAETEHPDITRARAARPLGLNAKDGWTL